VFVGAAALILGVLIAGSDYGWETWKTLLVQRPSRLGAYAAKLAVVALAALALVAAWSFPCRELRGERCRFPRRPTCGVPNSARPLTWALSKACSATGL
jgi:hypothetical protein